MIDLSLDEIDSAVIEAMNRVLSGAPTPGWKVEGQRCSLDKALWKALTDLAVAPADASADEKPTLLSGALIAERLGETLVGLPLLDHLVATRLLERLDSELARTIRAQDGVVGILTPALQTRDVQPPLSASGAIAGWIVRIVPDGQIHVAEVDPEDRPIYVENLGELPVGRVAIEESRWQALATARPDLAALAAAERRVLVSGAIAGICAHAIELASAYAKERELFGVPIGSFQSLAHSLSNAKVHADGTLLLSREAAWSLAGEPARFAQLAHMAYAHAAASGDVVTRAAVHIFGGYGLTREYPVQAYFRMARTLCLFTGDRRLNLQAVGRGLIAQKLGHGSISNMGA